MFATLAKQERARISERTIAGLKVARAKGKALGKTDASRRDRPEGPFTEPACRNRSAKNREEHGFSVGHSQCNADQIPTTDLLSKESYSSRQGHRGLGEPCSLVPHIGYIIGALPDPQRIDIMD